MAELKTYAGGCHCGAVAYEADMALDAVNECNCSHCAAKGFLLAFVPADQFRLKQGEDALTEYRFNEHKIEHLFCKICGVESFARGAMPDGSPIAAVNARCLEDVDLGALSINKIDGRSL